MGLFCIYPIKCMRKGGTRKASDEAIDGQCAFRLIFNEYARMYLLLVMIISLSPGHRLNMNGWGDFGSIAQYSPDRKSKVLYVCEHRWP